MNNLFGWKIDRVLSKFGEYRKEAIHRFVEFIHQKIDAEVDINDIFKASRIGVYGSKEFENIYLEEGTNFDTGKNVKLDMSLEDAICNICKHFNVCKEDLSSPSKNKKVVNARSALALIGRLAESLTLEDIASAIGKNHGTISRLATRAENHTELKIIAMAILGDEL